MSRVNKERLGQLLGEIQRHENIDDRYRAALRGETLTGVPGARIRGGGTSLPLPPVAAKEGEGGWGAFRVPYSYSYPLNCFRFSPPTKFGNLQLRGRCLNIPRLETFESEMSAGDFDVWLRVVSIGFCCCLLCHAEWWELGEDLRAQHQFWGAFSNVCLGLQTRTISQRSCEGHEFAFC